MPFPKCLFLWIMTLCGNPNPLATQYTSLNMQWFHKNNDKCTDNVLPRTAHMLNKRYTTVNKARFIASISIYDNTQESAVL